MAIRVSDECIKDEVASELLFGSLGEAPNLEHRFHDAEDILQRMIRLSVEFVGIVVDSPGENPSEQFVAMQKDLAFADEGF